MTASSENNRELKIFWDKAATNGDFTTIAFRNGKEFQGCISGEAANHYIRLQQVIKQAEEAMMFIDDNMLLNDSTRTTATEAKIKLRASLLKIAEIEKGGL